MRRILLIAAFAPLALVSSAQDPPAKDPAEEEAQKKVDAAIDKGVKWILEKYKTGGISDQKKAELICLTLVHSGLRRDHPFLVEQTNKLLNRPLSETYNAGLRALLMEKLDRRRFQLPLAETALFFVDSQCENGQWTYNGKSRRVPAQYVPTPTKRKDDTTAGSTRSDDDGIPPGKPIKIPPTAKPNGTRSGDNSNSQYAILGMFAAARANCELPKETLEKAVKWWESKQNPDGGWGYACAEVPDGAGNGIVTNASTGSMTTAGLTALIVCKFYLGIDTANDPVIQKGLAWLGSNLSYSTNPGSGSALWHYYYLYGLERVGQIAGMKEFGGKDWYKGGAAWLIDNQKPDGHWESAAKSTPQGDQLCDDVCNTCFAILFLRRATPELKRPKDIATGDTKKK